jgi:hypothetical protein
MKINKKWIVAVLVVAILLMYFFRREGFTVEQIDSIVSNPEFNVLPHQQLTIKDLIRVASEKGELETNPHLQFVFLNNPELKKAVMDAKGL